MKLSITISIVICFLILSCNQPKSTQEKTDNAAIKTSISSYLISQNSVGENKIDTLLTENFIRNINGIEMVSNLNEHQANMHVFVTGFPDMTLTFPAQLIKDNQAYVEWTFLGTNTGIYGDLTATGKKVKISGISHLYFDERNKIYREDLIYNELDLLQQLGYTLNPPITE